ncbi:DUF6734 family protein [Niastella populi]|nr:DUF6734 family protein [Niastella populi]
MKIIQSFWTRPFLQSPNLQDSRMNGGWPARKYNYFSWALSCLQLCRYYSNVELVTDDLGKFILIEKLKLPYTNVNTDLNRINNYNAGLWALGKIYAYSLQESPFLHVDSDIFIWNAFDDRIVKAPLTAQNKEHQSLDYTQTFNEICRKFPYVPDYLKELEGRQYVFCSNAGILGGTDIGFFKAYTNEIFRFIDENNDCIEENIVNMNSAYLNVIYEQVIFSQFAQKTNKEITFLFPYDIDIPKYIGFFHEADRNAGFVHCLGTYKQNRQVYRTLEMKMKTLYPDYYHLILELIDSSEL